MWDDGVGWLLALLGIAVSANLIARSHVRALRTIRAEAELLEKLPPGQARDQLAALVDKSVLEYVDDIQYSLWTNPTRRRFPSRLNRQVAWFKWVMLLLLSTMTITLTVWTFTWQSAGMSWPGTAIGLAVAWGMTLYAVSRLLRL